jgi:dTDP-4-amino-4,6-dideoxygalactose transaminase
MTDIQAALGLSQLNRLDAFVDKRHQIARRYDVELAVMPILTPWQHPDSHSSYHLYPIRLKLKDIQITQRQAHDGLSAAGVQPNLHYIPVYRQPYYEALGFTPGYCPEAERYYREAISIAMYPGLTDEQQTKVIETLGGLTV